MNNKIKINLFWGFITILFLNCLFIATPFAQDKQEIVVTINGISSGDKLTHFNNGESLRKQNKFFEAIEEYKQVISSGELCGKEAESHYNIGLCNTWFFELDKAEIVFHEVIKNYPDDDLATGNSEFCLAWIDVQKGNYNSAIDRLQNTLEKI
jgi:TolA-binding protein